MMRSCVTSTQGPPCAVTPIGVALEDTQGMPVLPIRGVPSAKVSSFASNKCQQSEILLS